MEVLKYSTFVASTLASRGVPLQTYQSRLKFVFFWWVSKLSKQKKEKMPL